MLISMEPNPNYMYMYNYIVEDNAFLFVYFHRNHVLACMVTPISSDSLLTFMCRECTCLYSIYIIILRTLSTHTGTAHQSQGKGRGIL